MSSINKALSHYEEMRKFKPWSRTKQDAIHRLRRHIGNVSIGQVSEQYLVTWALNYPGSILTAQTELIALSGALNYCHRRRLMEIPNPNAASEAQSTLKAIGAIQKSKRDPGRISDDMLMDVFSQWRSKVPTYYLLLLMDNVMRSGELCRIHWDDVDLDMREFIIRDRKSPIQKQGNDQRIAMRGRTFEILSAIPNKRGRICPHRQETISEAFTKASRRAGYPFVLHDLRHEGISRLFDQGYQIPQVQALSGHTTWECLQRYTHVTPQNIHALEARLRTETSPLNAFMAPHEAMFQTSRKLN